MVMQWARDTAAMCLGSVTTMYGCCLCNHRLCHCSQMPSGGRQGSLLPPPPPIQSPPPRPPGGITGPASTCRILSTPRVSPPCSRARCMLSTPCATILVGDDGRPSAPTSEPRQRPPSRRRSSITPLSLPSSSVAVPSLRHPPPLPPALVRALCGVRRIDRRCGKRASVIAFFSAPVVVGVLSSPSPPPHRDSS